MAWSSTAVKFTNNIRHTSKKFSLPSSVLWQYPIEEDSSKKLRPTSPLKEKLWNELFGEKLEDFSGNIPYAVMRLTAFPIKAIYPKPQTNFEVLKNKIILGEIVAEDKKKGSDYNKIIPRCTPATPRTPGGESSAPKKSGPCPCPPKKGDSSKGYPCKPKQQLSAQTRELSTVIKEPCTARDDIRYPHQNPELPDTERSTPPDNPRIPEQSPSIPQHSPQTPDGDTIIPKPAPKQDE